MSETPRLFDQALLAIDLEMTGLDPRRDHILSIGAVPLTVEGIPLGQAQHWLLQTDARVSDSATIHHLRDHDLKVGGGEPDEILQNLLQQLQDRVLITHGGELDIRFLDHRHRHYFGKKWRPQRLDTQYFTRRQLGRRSEQMPTAKALNLRACRERYHLPNWRAHHALSDAIATAELFQAQLRDAFPRDHNPPWRDARKSFSSLLSRWGWQY
ncbi:3'-5' exonuclease [Marinimicrobium alkaliphilum]|uniref:3'-5' exonuclease n=1 Tax=Marinimicrobium alkaliphilum TaxID=2202654 RepID=UPI001300574E|nr:3'-5' exonuclease [Marinimicrobium alkaliphilum]